MASKATIQQADAVVRSHAPGFNAAQRQIALAIGLLETGFGVDGSWLLDDGTPSYNWGGLVGSGTAGALVHSDRNPDGSPTEYKFKAFHNMGEAFDAFLATWSHGDVAGIGHPDVVHEQTVLPAAGRGDARAVATTMYAHGYYGGVSGGAAERIDAYTKAIVGAAGTVAGNLGEPLAVHDEGVAAASGKPPIAATRLGGGVGAAVAAAGALVLGAPLLPAALAAGVVYWALRRRRKS